MLTVRELAARWHCGRMTIWRAIREGRLKAFKVGERVYRIALAEVERYERTKEAA